NDLKIENDQVRDSSEKDIEKQTEEVYIEKDEPRASGETGTLDKSTENIASEEVLRASAEMQSLLPDVPEVDNEFTSELMREIEVKAQSMGQEEAEAFQNIRMSVAEDSIDAQQPQSMLDQRFSGSSQDGDNEGENMLVLAEVDADGSGELFREKSLKEHMNGNEVQPEVEILKSTNVSDPLAVDSRRSADFRRSLIKKSEDTNRRASKSMSVNTRNSTRPHRKPKSKSGFTHESSGSTPSFSVNSAKIDVDSRVDPAGMSKESVSGNQYSSSTEYVFRKSHYLSICESAMYLDFADFLKEQRVSGTDTDKHQGAVQEEVKKDFAGDASSYQSLDPTKTKIFENLTTGSDTKHNFVEEKASAVSQSDRALEDSVSASDKYAEDEKSSFILSLERKNHNRMEPDNFSRSSNSIVLDLVLNNDSTFLLQNNSLFASEFGKDFKKL
ncbi:hypothetical protein AX774_g2543, partial [Zancudomyces culisetae]